MRTCVEWTHKDSPHKSNKECHLLRWLIDAWASPSTNFDRQTLANLVQAIL
jgi:hypothetical protein